MTYTSSVTNHISVILRTNLLELLSFRFFSSLREHVTFPGHEMIYHSLPVSWLDAFCFPCFLLVVTSFEAGFKDALYSIW